MLKFLEKNCIRKKNIYNLSFLVDSTRNSISPPIGGLRFLRIFNLSPPIGGLIGSWDIFQKRIGHEALGRVHANKKNLLFLLFLLCSHHFLI